MILAHLGHWYVSLLYFGPVALLVCYLGVQNWRDRHGPDDDGTER